MKTTSTFLKLIVIVLLSLTTGIQLKAQVLDSLSSDFTLQENGCVQQQIKVTYIGNAPGTANYAWNFGGAVVISGSGQGPYYVKWESVGVKTVSLTVTWELQVSTSSKNIHIQPHPALFHMTGGGSYIAGGVGVHVGLSGSESGITYKLRRNGVYFGIAVAGTGSAIDFGLQTEPGTYTAVAYGPACSWEMEGTAVVTILEPPHQNICMVTFDTILLKNKIIWNKTTASHISHFNIYKETFQNEHYEKISEVPYSNLSVFVDQNSFPLVKSDKYRISITDSSTHESEKSPYHKTSHLNINAGIYGFNLMWNHYEGFEFLSYHIYRKFGNGPYELIAGIASNVDSYTDFYTEPGLVTYFLEVVRLEPCSPSMKSQDYNSVISNTATAAPLGIEDNNGSGVIVYPNPAKNKVIISLGQGFSGNAKVDIFQPNGQVVMDRVLTESRSALDVTNFNAGVYFVRISSVNSIVIKKIIKE